MAVFGDSCPLLEGPELAGEELVSLEPHEGHDGDVEDKQQGGEQ